MPRHQYDYERLSHHELLDVGQDKMLLLYDLWFASFERLSPQDQQRPELQKCWMECRMLRDQIAASRRLTNIRPEPVPRWVRRRLRKAVLRSNRRLVGRAAAKV